VNELLALLNRRPVVNGVEQDELAYPAQGRRWTKEHGGTGTLAELKQVRHARDLLQAVVRGEQAASALGPMLDGVHQRPEISENGLT
jgi:hypothetical protein